MQTLNGSNVVDAAQPQGTGSVELPIVYRAGDWCGALYRVELARARPFCEALDLEPWPVFGAAVAGVYAWEYRDTSIGPYAELGIGLLTRRRGQKPSLLRLALDMSAQDAQGLLVLCLPVTTEAACAAGKELWGYPKYVSQISTQFDEHTARVRLGSELELELGPVRGLARRLPIVTFTALGGQLLRTSIDVQSTPTLGLPSRAALRLLGGPGPTATVVQALGLHEHGPVLAFHTRAFRATLPRGEVTGAASRS
jgi:hypothetical protein